MAKREDVAETPTAEELFSLMPAPCLERIHEYIRKQRADSVRKAASTLDRGKGNPDDPIGHQYYVTRTQCIRELNAHADSLERGEV